MNPCFAFVGLILVLWIIWRKRHLSTFKRLNIPGPEPNLLFGNILELYRKGPIQCHKEWVNNYGRVLGYFYGMKPVLLVADPQILKDVFIRDFTKFCNREAFSPIDSYNPHDKYAQSFNVFPGNRWKHVRSVLTPAFTAAKLKQMTSIMNSSIETMVSILMEKTEKGRVIDAVDAYGRMILETIAETTFGLRTDFQMDAKSRLYKATRIVTNTYYKDPFLLIGLCFPWLRRCCHEAQHLFLGILNGGSIPRGMLRKTFETVIEHRRQNPKEGICDIFQFMINSKAFADTKGVDVDVNLDIGNTEYEEKLPQKINSNGIFKGMSDDEILSSANTVVLAGYGMITRALSFVTLLIAKHQHVQQKLYEEMKTLIPNEQRVECDAISKMQYMDKVINEALRMYPPVMLFATRFAVQDVEYGDLKIPKGMLVQAPTYLMHHDPEFWEDPDTFDPERFNDKMNTNGVVYLPFGVGPRNCFGMRLAKLELKFALAHVVRNFKITLADSEDKFELEFGMRNIFLKNGCRVKMEPRHPQDE